jgi:hypothetical protein
MGMETLHFKFILCTYKEHTIKKGGLESHFITTYFSSYLYVLAAGPLCFMQLQVHLRFTAHCEIYITAAKPQDNHSP